MLNPEDLLNEVRGISNSTPATVPQNNTFDIDSLAQISANVSGVSPEFIKAQWRHETNDFSNWGSKVANNFGGMKQFKPQPSWFNDDAQSPEGDNYQVFNSPQEYAEYFGNYIKKYVPGAQEAKTPEEYAIALKNMGYYGAPVEEYVGGLKRFLGDSSPSQNALNPESLLASVRNSNTPATDNYVSNTPDFKPEELLTAVRTQSQHPNDLLTTDQLQALNWQSDPESNINDVKQYLNAKNDKEALNLPEPVDFAGTIPTPTDSPVGMAVANAGLNLISSVAEANAEKDALIKKNKPEDSDPLWMKAARFVDKFAMTPGSAGLDVINQFARPEAAIGALTQHLWDKSQGRQTQNPDAISAAWQGFITNESDTTRMFKEMGMSDTQAFWANLGRQIIADPLIVIKPAMLVEKAAKASKAMGVTDKVMPIITKMAKSDAGYRIGAVRDFIMGNRPTEAMLDAMKATQANDLFEGQKIAKQFKNATKGLSKEQLDTVNKAMQSSHGVLPITPVDPVFAGGVVQHHYDGTLSDKIVNKSIAKEEAIAAFLQQGEEVPRYLLDDRQWYLYQEGLKAAQKAPQTVLVPDAIARGQYLQDLEKSGVKPELVQEVDSLIDGWQKWNQGRFNDELLTKGLISDETFARYMDGTHLKRAYETYNNSDKFLGGVIKHGTGEERLWAAQILNEQRGSKNTNKIPLSDLIERKALSPETMQKMGIITDAEYNIMNTVKGSSNVLSKSDYLGKVSDMFGKTEQEMLAMGMAQPGVEKRFVQLNGKAYGALDGKWVPTNVRDDVDNVVNGPTSVIPQVWQKTVGVFKVEKLLDIPPIFRNFYSMIPMVNTFGNVPLIGKGGSPIINSSVNVATDLFNFAKGAQNTVVEKAKRIGLLDTSWTKSEAQALLNYEGEFSKAGTIDKVKWLADKGMQVFGSPDQLGRLIVFDYWLKQGKSESVAAKIAKTALLDYDKAPVWVNFMSKSGVMPFARFPWLAGVETAKALYRDPASVTKYTKAFKGSEADDRNTILPKYLRGSELLPIGESTRVINGKQVKVQEHLDMNYIMPFFNEFYLGNPISELLQIYRTGKSSNGMQIVNENMSPEDKARVYGKYIRDSFGPSITSSYGWPSKMIGAMNQEVDYKGRMYSPKDAVMQTFGLKNVPVNYPNEIDKREREQSWKVREIKSQMRRLESDATLTPQQRMTRQKEYERMIEQVDKENIEMWRAYKRIKTRANATK